MAKNKDALDKIWIGQQVRLLDGAIEDWRPDVSAALAQLKAKESITRNDSRWKMAGLMVLGFCLLLAALPSPRALARRCLECSLEAWESLVPRNHFAVDLIPDGSRVVAPDFTLKDANNKVIKLSDLKGKVVLVNFWATWCEGCQVEIPWFVEFQKKYETQGLTVIGISMDDDGWKSVKPWIREMNVNYSVVIGNGPLGKQYGLGGMPLTALVDRSGKIADIHSGVVDKVATEEKIRKLLARQ